MIAKLHTSHLFFPSFALGFERNYYRHEWHNILRGIGMERKKLAILVVLAISLPVLTGCVEKFTEVSGFSMETIDKIKSERNYGATPVIVSEENPFYAVIATPVALYYDEEGQHVEPLLVENFDNP